MAVNVRLLRQQVAAQADRTIRPQVEKAIALDFKTKQRQFLEAFDNHDVTKELKAGPNARSRIPAIAATGGNLFSLLGFYAEQDPIGALRKYLKASVTLGKTRRGKLVGTKMVYETPVEIPTVEDIDTFVTSDPQTNLEWTDRPFTNAIANGISGLPKYLFDKIRANSGGLAASRSGPAVQTKNTLRSGSTPGIPYISDVLGYLKRLITFKK
jgi:hypothetical protein